MPTDGAERFYTDRADFVGPLSRAIRMANDRIDAALDAGRAEALREIDEACRVIDSFEYDAGNGHEHIEYCAHVDAKETSLIYATPTAAILNAAKHLTEGGDDE